MLIFNNIEELQSLVNQELPKGTWTTVTQEMINDFASATKDQQWIHLDQERAKHTPFKTTIAHGFFSISMISKFIADLIAIKSAKMVINYGLENVRFPHHVPVDAEIRLQASLNKIEAMPHQRTKLFLDFVIAIKNVEKPACCGQFIFLVQE